MKDTIRLIITHFFIITVSVLFFISLFNQFKGIEAYPANFPWVVMLTGILGAIPSALFYFKKEPSKNQFRLRLMIHYLVIEAVIMTEGFILKWYESFAEGLEIFVIVLLVYIVVFAYTYFVAFNTANSINKALDDFNSDEEE